jgi:hypothetical protein
MSLVEVAMRRAGDGGLDKIVAAVAASVAAVAVFLMPAGVLEQAVLASGMPDMLPQLSPPLGMKARAGLALLSAGSAFGSTLLMLRLLGFFTGKKRAAPAPAEEDAPRIRRRDRHPDAPVRAPLRISRDLGEPSFEADPVAPVEPEPTPFDFAPPRVQRPATRRRAPLIEVVGDIHDAAEAAPAADAGPAAEDPRRIKPGRAAEEAVPVAPPEPVAAPEVAEPEVTETTVEEPIVASEPKLQWEPQPEPVIVVEAPVQPARMEEPAQAAPAQESLAELLARFERAIELKQEGRRATDHVRGGEAEAADAEEGMDLRLRSALENLRRFAPSRG